MSFVSITHYFFTLIYDIIHFIILKHRPIRYNTFLEYNYQKIQDKIYLTKKNLSTTKKSKIKDRNVINHSFIKYPSVK